MQGGVVGFIGFMLSPLSWWNDAFVNVPLAVAFGWIVTLFYKPAFDIGVLAGYWLTNVLGFVLLHKGVKAASGSSSLKPYTWGSFARDLSISLAYTGLIALLLKLKLLQPFTDYLHKG